MKTYILLRYDNRPNPAVSDKLFEYVAEGKKPYFTTLPGVMITQFDSEEIIDIIKAGLDTLNIKFDLVEKPASVATTSAAASVAPASNDIRGLKAALQAALHAQNFEKAAELRDKITAIEGPATPPTTERVLYTSITEFKKSLVVVEKKKKDASLDKVGEEDEDINNDGKKDKQDSFLLNRRKKIASSKNRKTTKIKNSNNDYIIK